MLIKNTFPALSLWAGVATFFALTFAAAPSRAEIAIGADLDYAVPVKSDAESGWGFGIRLGYQMHVPAVVLTPEIAFTYHDFSGNFAPKVYRGLAGLRLGIGEIIRPGVFGHLGMGRFAIDIPGLDSIDISHTAFTYDFGAFLDFTLIPIINIGVHAAYNHLNGGNHADGFQWVTLGAEAAIIF
jgi:hypothetical protein